MSSPTIDPSKRSWVHVPEGSDFPIQNLPFGIFSPYGRHPRVGVAIGESVLDVAAVNDLGLFQEGYSSKELETATLNELMGRGKQGMRVLRSAIAALLDASDNRLKPHAEEVLYKQDEVQMYMPVEVGDYTDFYSSKDHATNVGKMFRDPDNALLPNWKHIPVGYHGRSSSIVISGTPVHRPMGQTKPKEDEPPVYGPSRLLDFELEMAFITFDGKPLGQRISTAEAEDYIFGMVLFNDWSARDIQKWEYVPLGPFLGKNFGSSISPWIVSLDALAPFRVKGEDQDPPVLPYLEYDGARHIDIELEVGIAPPNQEEHVVGRTNYRYMYWTMEQQLAHHTVNGCNIRCGDMMASGTISGPEESSFGSMLELSWRGSKPIPMPDGSERKFIQDHDTVIMRGRAEKDGIRIGFGEVRTELLPAIP